MIPSAEAARNTDDFRTVVTPGNGADDGGCGQKRTNTNEESMVCVTQSQAICCA